MSIVRNSITRSLTSVALTLVLAAPSWAQPVQSGDFPFRRSIIFGDSLSDNGGLKDATNGLSGAIIGAFLEIAKHATDGRISNGSVWDEYLVPNQDRGVTVSFGGVAAAALGFTGWAVAGNYGATGPNGGKSINYAVAGAKYLTPDGIEGRVIPTPGAQVDAFLKATGYATNSIDKNDLVTFWAGANDGFEVVGKGALTEASADTSKQEALKSLNKLYAAGGRKFLIPDLPNFGSTPRFNANGQTIAAGNETTDIFNRRIAAAISEFQASHPDATIFAPKIGPLVDTAVKYGSDFGFTNVTQGCYYTDCFKLERGSEAQNAYLFWDDVHPTTRMHAYLANYIKQYWLNPDLAGFYTVSPSNLFSTVRHYFFPDDARTLAGYLTGDAALYKLNGGTLTVTGENTYTGGTFIRDGGLRIGNGGTTGSIIGNVEMGDRALLQFDRSNTYVFDGVISGKGSVEQNGSGRTVLTGASSYTGDTIVNKGMLSVNGSLASKVTVNNGGIIGGTGTIGGLSAKSGGLVSPGNAIGKLTVNDDASFDKGSGLAIEVAGDGRSDKLTVTGTATLNGGTVYVRPENSTSLLTEGQVKTLAGKSYVILTANEGVNGRFDNATPYYRFYGAHLNYNPDDVILTLARNGTSFASAGTTANQKMAAASIQSMMVAAPEANTAPTSVTGDNPAKDPANNTAQTQQPQAAVTQQTMTGKQLADAPSTVGNGNGDTKKPAIALYNEVAASTINDNLPIALTALSGDVHASLRGMLLEDNRFRDAATNRVREAFDGISVNAGPASGNTDKSGAATIAMWGQAYGSWNHVDSSGNAIERNRSIGGFVTGIDGIVADNWRLGILAGYANSSMNGAGSSASVDSYQVGIYGGTQWDALGLRFGGTYAHHQIDTDRSVTFGGIADSTNASYDANSLQIFGETGYEIKTSVASFEPFAGLAYTRLKTDSFTETGGATALSGFSGSTEATTSTLGLRASRQFHLGDTTTMTAKAMVAWQHAMGDTTPEAKLAFAGGTPFSVEGLPIAKDALALEAGLDFNLSRNTSLGISYRGQIADHMNDHSIKADLSIKF
ncbi:autotransporter domain-containing protein [Phyllobacterium sp. OV277]|uniref:autotransporter domain-containing protein n=1 Tax=Phyllobacterium sp. OV277 TaxID=1882772 RepID=UPI00088B901B|nr:autotransporter domain-containing protein [Phyllobacterium sp. OV277]SDP68182.1 outer membrane autotransporter barrel domain-containing protein [Phyllobacterium sp. OV277]